MVKLKSLSYILGFSLGIEHIDEIDDFPGGVIIDLGVLRIILAVYP